LVIGVYRSTDVRRAAHPLNVVKNELHVHRQCEELSLSFLAEESIIAYLTARFPDSTLPTTLGSSLCKRTEGNPLFMVNMVDHLARQGLIAHGLGMDHPADIDDIERYSRSLRQLIQQQMDFLEPLTDFSWKSPAWLELGSCCGFAAGYKREELTENTVTTRAQRAIYSGSNIRNG
jgi:hypothetical protein